MRIVTWILIWVLLVLAASGFLLLRVRVLWRQAKALGRELSEAEAGLTAVTSAMQADGEPSDHGAGTEPPAIFQSPLAAREAQISIRETNRAMRAERRERARPAWARPSTALELSTPEGK